MAINRIYINDLLVIKNAHSPTNAPEFGFKGLDLGSSSPAGDRGPILTEQCYLRIPVPSPDLGLNRQRLIGGGEGGRYRA